MKNLWEYTAIAEFFHAIITIEDRIRCRDNNFTLIRLLAAYAVLFAHSYALSTGHSGQDPLTKIILAWWGQGLGGVAVVIFFVVSGFLVGGSYIHRDNLFAFAEARFLRIFPALFAAMLFCVFIVGLWVTTLPPLDFLKHQGTWSFIWHNTTLLWGIHFHLPGVFATNPWPHGVNGSLWTLPIELYMYCIVMLLGALGILKHRPSFNVVAILLCVALLCIQQKWIVVAGIPAKHAMLVTAYIAGIFFYVNQRFIPLTKVLVVLVVCAMVLLHGTVIWPLLQVFALSYIVLFLALHPNIKLPNIDRWGDYSYGLYIYAFPVQQMVAKYITTSPIEMLLYSTLITCPLAILSWRYIEKPALALKGSIALGRKWLDPRVKGRNAKQ